MDEELRKLIELRITTLGLKKEHVGKRIGLDKSSFSHTLAGRRKISDSEKAALLSYLGL